MWCSKLGTVQVKAAVARVDRIGRGKGGPGQIQRAVLLALVERKQTRLLLLVRTWAEARHGCRTVRRKHFHREAVCRMLDKLT